MTTIASVWTHNQFIDGVAITGQPLQLKITAGNVPSFVDLNTGGWGGTIQDPLNSSQTPTVANFATLANVLAGCVTQVKADACDTLFQATNGPAGATPTNTLTAAQAIARAPWFQPERIFALLEAFYPVSPGKPMRAVPYMRANGTTVASSVKATAPNPASPSPRRSTWPSTSRTASGCRTVRFTSSASRQPTRARP